MPCYDPRDHIESHQARRDIDYLTDMLCRTCQACISAETFRFLPEDIKQWFIEHDRNDQARKP